MLAGQVLPAPLVAALTCFVFFLTFAFVLLLITLKGMLTVAKQKA